jgi:hypothetical protein
MRLSLKPGSSEWQISEMDDVHLMLLRQAGDDASMTDCEEGRSRLFPSPVAKKEELPEGEFLEDWAEYVTEELDTQFAEDVGILLDDLDAAERQKDVDSEHATYFLLKVPVEHGDAWFSALNQARLMLDIKFKLHPEGREFEPEESAEVLGEVNLHERLSAYMRYEFYAFVQEWLVRHVLK